MSKVIPIQVEAAKPIDYKLVSWKIHNVCNYDCSFCGIENKDGTQRWKSLDEYKQIVDKLFEISNGKKTWIQFTGGEPTLYPDFIKLATYAKHKGFYVSMISNGSRTLRWWNELKEANAIDWLFLTYHPEQTSNHQHFADVINIFEKVPVQTFCMVTYTRDIVEKAITSAEFFYENTGAFITLYAMHILSYSIYDFLSDDQLDKIKKLNWRAGKRSIFKKNNLIPEEHIQKNDLKIIFSDNSVEFVDSMMLQKDNKNHFRGWECDIGMDTLHLTYDVIHRGVCQIGGEKPLTLENLEYWKDSVICDADFCPCGIDLNATKRYKSV